MERYYRTDVVSQRSNRNQSLYDTIYEKNNYSNIEGIANIDKPNEIDINQVRQLIKPEEEKVRRRFNDSFADIDRQSSFERDYDTANYDIKNILSKAKNDRTVDLKHRNLRNTQYDILKSLNLEKDEEKEELQELFNTITSNSKLNKLGNKELGLDMFQELKTSGANNEDSLSIQSVINQNNQSVNDNEPKLDESFYTSSFNFDKDDFDDFRDVDSPKKGNIFIKILVFISLVIVATTCLLVIYQFLMK